MPTALDIDRSCLGCFRLSRWERWPKSQGDRRVINKGRWYKMPLAIQREKNIKRWSRAWKLELVEDTNAQGRDLWGEICR